ncbi:endolytic transglycosylase MltG [Pseudanabaena sp. FACHB-1998]|uniref:endolytic transglycosylase MltG n=1 Tax=Pseudanabaena sp. FACHB-1998 TaxID=2692858 RepID=UPI001F54D77B|nr:endolytic transglycosylase MltG [Pseudanabaena sp. FACHB-1998]
MSSAQKMPKKSSNWLFYGLALPITILLTGIASSSWWIWASSAPSTFGAKVRLTISDGMPTQAIAQELESAGVIRSSLALRLWIQWQSLRGSESVALRSGTYDFATNQSLQEVVSQIQTAKSSEVRFTIPEGWSIAQMSELFEKQGFFTAKDFIAAAQRTNPRRRAWLPDDIPSLEGFLFPDTYQILPSEATPDLIIDLMLDRFEQVALPIYKENQAGKPRVKISLKDWVTLASIVEKEAVIEAERRVISGVFWNRIRKNMRLESDPTVEYGLNIKQTPENPLTLEQVRTASPYNTYLNEGLPPGPIASVGLASLKATLEPSPTDYLFFVAKYDGSHVFSRNLEDHEKALQAIDKKIQSKSQR